jgi:hypothetical protein
MPFLSTKEARSPPQGFGLSVFGKDLVFLSNYGLFQLNLVSALYSLSVVRPAAPKGKHGQDLPSVPRSYSFPRASSQGSSSLGALACSALGAVVQNGSGASPFFFFFSSLISSIGGFLLFCVMIFTPSAVCQSLLRPSCV